jgi:hypothetical protein
MTFKTKVGVAGGEELGVDRTVRSVTDRASFADGLVFEDVRATLGGVASEAGFIGIKQRHAAAGMNRPLVGGVTLRATHFPLRHRMVAGEVELATHVEVAIKADVFLEPPGREHRMGAAELGVWPTSRQNVGRLHLCT